MDMLNKDFIMLTKLTFKNLSKRMYGVPDLSY